MSGCAAYLKKKNQRQKRFSWKFIWRLKRVAENEQEFEETSAKSQKTADENNRVAQKPSRVNGSFSVCSHLPDSLGVLQRAGGAWPWLEDDTHVLAVLLHTHTLHLWKHAQAGATWVLRAAPPPPALPPPAGWMSLLILWTERWSSHRGARFKQSLVV